MQIELVYNVCYTSAAIMCLEDTKSITERGNVSCSVLLVHCLSGHAFNNHISENSHHSSTTVVELNIELAGLLLRVLDIVTKPSDSVVSVVLGSRHPCELNKGEEEKDLEESGGRDSTNSVNSSGKIRKLKVLRGRQVSIESDVVVVDNASDNGHHGNTSVLALDSATTLERFWLVVQPSERIKDTKWGSSSELKLVDHIQGGGSLAGLDRDESGGRADEESSDGDRHEQQDDRTIYRLE